MRVVKLDTMKPSFARPVRSRREDRRQFIRQLANVLQVHIRDALAIAVQKRFQLAWSKDRSHNFIARILQKLADQSH